MRKRYVVDEQPWKKDELIEKALNEAIETVETYGLKGRLIEDSDIPDLPLARISYPEPRARDRIRNSGRYWPAVIVSIMDPLDFEDLAKALEAEVKYGGDLMKRYFDRDDVRYVDFGTTAAEIVRRVL